MKIKKYENLPGNGGKRSGEITHIVIHHAAGDLSLDTCYRVLKNAKISANFAIDPKGNVGQFLDEKLEPYTTSNRQIDDKALTIEVSNCKGAPNWEVSDSSLEALINLCVDICRRHKFKLNFTGDKKGNLHMHKWYKATACPGPYLASKFEYIADEVNKILEPSKPEPEKPEKPEPKPTEELKIGDKVKIKSGSKDQNGSIYNKYVYENTYEVIQVKNTKGNVVFGVGKAVTGATKKENVIKI